ncbi:TPA: PDC sensor domain-containing protein [Pseudomonas aeruginosa]|uniref:cache domain-containing protein n=1 Tax=Pseudomonas aeruginosa TaxID=287 RepID=UPI000B48F249|nr:cache domain-containing protein [Pseudomonas aeruginosa]MBG4351735.1 PDC sensor domain-containing protein [Pseudomonas aeruginosa]MCU9105308.1 cache domain-containing protein [Pseudomonas aeruginosa]MCU9249784.1 cache domain-containing protein [Pseudomonas aeruginosa]MCU9304551.1 cache domain-containing protein [Pseudomonas aeruginosa]MCU9510340.1 cache domain-containing protein [Pseudomonas aeruginosa]
MPVPFTRTEADTCAANINASIGNVFDQLALLADEVSNIWKHKAALGKKPTSKDLSSLKPKIDAQLLAPRSCIHGTGVVLEPGELEDREMYLEWFRLGTGGKVVPMTLNFNQRSESFYNYQDKPWFSRPRATGSNVVVGPYVDLYGADTYIMTFSLPILVDGQFIGIAGADIALHHFERILLASLIKMENEALIVSEEGRVIAANTANWTVGDMAKHTITRQEADCQVLELGEAAAHWSLVRRPFKRKMHRAA